MEKAGFGGRFVAYLVDNILVGLISTVLFGCCAGPAYLLGGQDEDVFIALIVVISCLWVAGLFIIQFVYFGYFWSKRGQSPGKMLLDIKVEKDDGSMLSFFEAGLRGTFGYWLSSVIFYLGFLWALFDENKETWHDKIFSTQVMYKSERIS